jgi:hypothetical protein
VYQCNNWPKPLDFGVDPCNDSIMKKTTLDLSAIMASYTAQVAADERRRQAIRDGLLPKPQPTTVWCVSDRH